MNNYFQELQQVTREYKGNDLKGALQVVHDKYNKQPEKGPRKEKRQRKTKK